MRLQFIPFHLFLATPQVCFFNASVPHNNGADLVVHHGPAISPPDPDGAEHYYVHQHRHPAQASLGSTPSPDCSRKGHGGLEIPVCTYHR
ncbi:hypothetical protein [Cyanobium sp. WKJ7-Wakatipu]|uniref:hypothetical protein n=1 Tax=Cyanobium sp. WKJ7-Wakatipu TaxID=2823726 RepID=UPI0020CC4D03|nr:hypothetical protein [Cyanobium sp. WKJ7-Wakatipu]